MKWLIPALWFLAALAFFVAASIQRWGAIYIVIGIITLVVTINALHRVSSARS